jgi:hypothetical protein
VAEISRATGRLGERAREILVAQIVQVAALEFRVGQLAAAEVRLVAGVEIASATAAFHRVADLVRAAAHLAAVDSVEARLDPLVRAEAAAWVVVDLAAVEAVAVGSAVVEDAAAVVDEVVVAVVVVKQSMHEENQ